MAMLAALVTGIPTGIVRTPIYTRMTPVTWWDYPIWVLSAGLIGLTVATYIRLGTDRVVAAQSRERAGRSVGASVLSFTAIGCPVCNKVVVAAIGTSGALNYFAPVQPLLGAAGVTLLAVGLVARLLTAASCPLPR